MKVYTKRMEILPGFWDKAGTSRMHLQEASTLCVQNWSPERLVARVE
jgi:hypothetical protein